MCLASKRSCTTRGSYPSWRWIEVPAERVFPWRYFGLRKRLVMNELWKVPRGRGTTTGTLIVLLGIWGALVPLVGPYFDYGYVPDDAWSYDLSRLCLAILPGAGAVLGGLIVVATRERVLAILGAWLAAVSGAWFVVGYALAPLELIPDPGAPIGGTVASVAATIGLSLGLGVAIVFFAAIALGRMSVVGVREAEAAATERAESTEPDTTAPSPARRLRHRHP